MKTSPKSRTKRNLTTVTDRIYYEIQDRILYRVWMDGHQVLEKELADDLGVSRTPVREALIRLERDGLIKVTPRHGMRVLPMSPTDVREIYQILSSLESLAVGLAASRKPAAKEFEPLEQANAKMTASHEASDLKAWATADEIFHQHLIELSGNKILVEEHQHFWARAQRARLTMLSIISTPARSTREHMLLLEAIRNGDPSLAKARLESHLEHIINYVNNLRETERNGLHRF